jgi:integrase
MPTFLDAKNAKAEGKPRRLSFGAGLYLWITPAGTKSWRCNYSRDGNQVAVLGHFPEMAIVDAKAAKDAIRTCVREGGDPRALRHAAKVERRQTDGTTIESVGRQWVRFGSDAWTPRYRVEVERRLARYVYPKIGAIPVSMVGREQLLDLVHATKGHSWAQAVHVRQHLSAIFDFALADPATALAFNPIQRNAKYLPTRKTARKPEAPRAFVRTIEDARKVLAAVEARIAGYRRQPLPASLLAHRLIALTAVRKMEAVEAQWSEVDLDAAIWTIPAARMKGKRGDKRDHVVILAPQALDVLRTARRLAPIGSSLVFPARLSARSSPLEDSTLNELLKDRLALIGMTGRHTVHGWRSSFSTICNEADEGASRAVTDSMLAHKLKGESHVEGRYMHAQWLAARRRIACAWADMLLAGAPSAAVLVGLEPAPSNVIPMREAA